MTKLVRVGWVLGLVFLAARADAATITIDGIVAGSYDKTGSYDADHGVSIRSQIGLYLGKGPGYGALVQYEMPSSDTKEYILGGGVRLGGAKAFLELGGGYLTRDISGFKETGWGAIVKPGLAAAVSGSWQLRLSIPFVYKNVTSGAATRTLIDYVPYVGVAYEL
jgi:hypothetical protein